MAATHFCKLSLFFISDKLSKRRCIGVMWSIIVKSEIPGKVSKISPLCHDTNGAMNVRRCRKAFVIRFGSPLSIPSPKTSLNACLPFDGFITDADWLAATISDATTSVEFIVGDGLAPVCSIKLGRISSRVW